MAERLVADLGGEEPAVGIDHATEGLGPFDVVGRGELADLVAGGVEDSPACGRMLLVGVFSGDEAASIAERADLAVDVLGRRTRAQDRIRRRGLAVVIAGDEDVLNQRRTANGVEVVATQPVALAAQQQLVSGDDARFRGRDGNSARVGSATRGERESERDGECAWREKRSRGVGYACGHLRQSARAGIRAERWARGSYQRTVSHRKPILLQPFLTARARHVRRLRPSLRVHVPHLRSRERNRFP